MPRVQAVAPQVREAGAQAARPERLVTLAGAAAAAAVALSCAERSCFLQSAEAVAVAAREPSASQHLAEAGLETSMAPRFQMAEQAALKAPLPQQAGPRGSLVARQLVAVVVVVAAVLKAAAQAP